MRIHLFEIEDYPWYPSFLRELQTDYLKKLMDIFKVYRAIIPQFIEMIDRSGSNSVLDFCSGSGGSWMQILPDLRKDRPGFRVMLTDLYPNVTAFMELKAKEPKIIDFLSHPVNALDPPDNQEGIRTYFNSFHHFREEEAEEILRKAVQSEEGVAIFEPMEKSILQWVLNTFSTFFLAFLITPLIRPFRWDRLFFTYIIPILPLVTTWDGWVSILRLHPPESMLKIARKVGPDYDWEAGKASHTFGKVYFMFGVPKKKG